jgi:hypothetical protein
LCERAIEISETVSAIDRQRNPLAVHLIACNLDNSTAHTPLLLLRLGLRRLRPK